jgi:hypothetical protein
MPAFLRHSAEATLIGRLLAGYGELEYVMGMCLGAALNNEHMALRTLFRMKSERVKVADSLFFPLCEKAGLAGPYTAAYGGMKRCATIRNQYAHSNWADDLRRGLFFVDLQESTKSALRMEYDWKHIDVALLVEQEAFFLNTMAWWDYIRDQFDFKSGRHHATFIAEPPRLPQPPLHNPPDQHVPPWTSSIVKSLPSATLFRGQCRPPRGVRDQGRRARENQDENAPPLSRRREGVARPKGRQRRRAENLSRCGLARDARTQRLEEFWLRIGF